MATKQFDKSDDKLRWYQFRLRTLLIFVTLFACVCSLFALWYNKLHFRSPWHSAKMQQIQREYESLCRSFGPTNTKDDWGKQMSQIDDLLDKKLSLQEMRGMIADCEKLPKEEAEWNAFESNIFLRMFWTFVKAGDRDSLVKLLSIRFTSRYYFADTEAILVSQGNTITDPILILDDAYSKCKNPEVQQKIAQAIRHAFVGSGIRGNNDADFVKNAFEWYRTEKEHLVFSSEYLQNGYNLMKRYYRHPMFVKKGSPLNEQPTEDKLAPATIEMPRTVTNSIGMKLALIPPGEFMMGARNGENGNKENEEPMHRVRITKPFWMGVYEVTQEEYKKLMGEIPDDQSESSRLIARTPGINLNRLPVDYVRWYEAAEFCNRLSKKEDLPAYYGLSAEDRNHDRTVTILGDVGYRLPTEAEWEYACRAGTTTCYSFGDAIYKTKANVKESAIGRPVEVGSYPPNIFGLFDMHGNVIEWCNDAYEASYYVDCPLDDPLGPLIYPKGKNNSPELPNDKWAVIRGGSFAWDGDDARSAYRYNWVRRDESFGFRVARTSSHDTDQKLANP